METYDVTVRAVREVGPDAVALELTTPAAFDAYPGQFVLVKATLDGEELSRYYTISSPDVDETFELTVGIDPDGDLSPWLADLEPGDTLTVGGPLGNVYYETGNVVVLAGGPGVGPAVGIAERARIAGHEATVVYQDDEPIHEDRLADLSIAGATVTIVGDDEGLAAAVADLPVEGEVYVFGFKDFCDAALAAIEAAGGDPDAAHVESFG